MRAQIGVVGHNPGWEILLEQEGVSYALDPDRFFPEELSAVVLTGTISSTTLMRIREYLHAGGAVLCSGEQYAALFGEKVRKVFLKYIYPASNSVFSGCGVIDLFLQGGVIPQGNEMQMPDRTCSVFFGEVEGGHVVVLPFDAGDAIIDRRTRTKSFYALNKRLPFEHVSLVTKGGVRKLVSRSLELLHHRRGYYYVHRWYYPGDAKNIFVLRIDTDGASRAEIGSLYQALNTLPGNPRFNKIPATWFVDVKSQQHWLSDYSLMENQEIGVHCYEHRPYTGYEDCIKDITEAKRVMGDCSLLPKGFAAPYGAWNVDIARAIEESSFEYSSEFSCDYDNLPSSMSLPDKISETTQVPVHPISIGSLRRQGFDGLEMRRYYRHLIRQKLLAREPLIFYYHPKDRHQDVLVDVCSFVVEQGIPALSMIDYVVWWKERQNVQLELNIESSHVSAIAEKLSGKVWLHVTRNDSMEAIVPIQQSIDFNALVWTSMPNSLPLPEDFSRSLRFNPWIPLQRTEDFLFKKLQRY